MSIMLYATLEGEGKSFACRGGVTKLNGVVAIRHDFYKGTFLWRIKAMIGEVGGEFETKDAAPFYFPSELNGKFIVECLAM